MNARLQICQAAYDAKLPPPVTESPQEIARAEWIYGAAEMLVKFGYDVKFQRRMCAPQGVTVQQFALAVDELANNRLAECKVDSSALGWLLLSTMHSTIDKNAAADLLGRSEHPMGKLWEVAESLLEPLAEDALKAQAEDEEL